MECSYCVSSVEGVWVQAHQMFIQVSFHFFKTATKGQHINTHTVLPTAHSIKSIQTPLRALVRDAGKNLDSIPICHWSLNDF